MATVGVKDEKRKVDPDGRLIPFSKEHIAVPSPLQCFLKATVDPSWLGLGDDEGDDVKDQVVTELNNVALTAALMLTIQFALLFYLPDMNWDEMSAKWGQSFADYSLDYCLLLTITGTGITWIGMVYCILMLLCLNELNGPSEVASLVKYLGTKQSAGFGMMMVGTITMAVVGLYTSFIFHKKWWNMVISIVVAVIAATYFSYPTISSLMHGLYKVKDASTRFPPICLTEKEILEYISRYVSEVGEHYVSAEAVLRFVLDDKAKDSTEKLENGREIRYYRSLAPLSKRLLEGAVEAYMNMVAESFVSSLDKNSFSPSG